MGESLDGRALAQLYRQHAPAVYRRALRILGNPEDAREALQEVFIRVMHGSDGFEQRSSVTTWLYRITTNYCLNFLRDRRRRSDLLAANPVSLGARSDEGQISVNMVLLRRLLGEADEKQAMAALYVFVDGASHEEAAEMLGVSRRTVGNLLERFQEWAQHQLATEVSRSVPGRATPMGVVAKPAAGEGDHD